MKILILNGANINFLGVREKEVYGSCSYEEMCTYIKREAGSLDVDVDVLQSNMEGEIINYIQGALGKYEGIVINPGAYTHYSIAIHDAIKSVPIKTVEVHLSNIYAREEFRRKSVTAPACIGQISGFGMYGYIMAMMALKNELIIG